MTKKHLYYATLNTIINLLFFVGLIIVMFTEMISFSLATTILSPTGVQPEPGITFNFISLMLNISPIIFITSIIGSWVAYFKKSKKLFNFFILITWGFIIIASIGYLILILIGN